MAGFYYDIGHASVYSYVPLSSVYDTPAGAYIIHDPAGFDTKHDSATPTEIVPLGQLVAIVIYSSSIAIYPDGQSVAGALPKIHTPASPHLNPLAQGGTPV